MGASLTSPLPHRPPTSVCNHLFTASDAPPLFRTHPINEPNKRHHSMLAVGWNWSKKAAQQIQSQSSKKSSAVTSRSTDSMLLRGSHQRNGTTRELPYIQLSVALDNNQNYKKYEPTTNNSHRRDSITVVDSTTVIPNFYSIREEIRRELKLSKQASFV
ncbi:Cyclin-dependent kinase 5 activator 1 [Toxocara canis]|uniref:Cyclin-dependent kinase 5 activator 1 n=1 Tax=Toxocara canis TaxID=6265 RepID=A0A0B2VEJ0_TOXCA|nr:Cyclin-dependent kinase 5 activator 1 [Toxocara canis]